MSNRTERRVERIKAEVPIDQVLANYGYRVYADGGREQQFSCDLHGDGRDGKPSARCYPSTNQWYCWGCQVSRDAIQTVREKQGVGFLEAIDILEKEFNLPPMPWEEGDYKDNSPTRAIEESLKGIDTESLEMILSRSKNLLIAMTKERVKPLAVVLRFWEQFDYVSVMSDTRPDEMHPAAVKLMAKIIEEMKS